MTDSGFALTIHQPWAAAIIQGPKRVENRTWRPPPQLVGQRLWIHAGKTFDEEGYDSCVALWKRSGAVRTERIVTPQGVIVGSARLVAVKTSSADPWFFGPIGWILDEVRALPVPVPCRGLQKVWRVPPSELAAARAQDNSLWSAERVLVAGGSHG